MEAAAEQDENPKKHLLAYLAELRARVAAAEAAGGDDDGSAAAAAAQPQRHTSAAAVLVSESEDDSDSDTAAAGVPPKAGGHSQVSRQHHSPISPHLQPIQRSVTYTNGDTYSGWMLGDQRHGEGVHTTAGDGSTYYEGAWRFDARHGHGTFRAANGLVFTGSWVDDKASGPGCVTYPDGSRYEGDFEADVRSGWGVLEAADGQRYEGEWRHDQPDGAAPEDEVLVHVTWLWCLVGQVHTRVCVLRPRHTHARRRGSVGVCWWCWLLQGRVPAGAAPPWSAGDA